MTFSSPLEVSSRVTSGFGKRWGILHAGYDYGPPVAGVHRRPVYAVGDGPIIRVGRGNGQAGAEVVPYHSGKAVWQDLGTIGGDRIRAYYGHVDEYIVAAGEYVHAGQVIGYMGGTGPVGRYDYATHLHFGIAQNHDRPTRAATALGDPGWINPHVWLQGKGITVGRETPLTHDPLPVAKPSRPVTTAPEVGGGATGKHVRSEASIRAICIKAGHHDGNKGTGTGLLIERYQHRQVDPFQLPWDRQWGKRTEAHYRWVLQLQRAMNTWKGGDVAVDGDYGKVTVGRVRSIQSANAGRAYKGRVDAVAGPMFCRMLGIPAHP